MTAVLTLTALAIAALAVGVHIGTQRPTCGQCEEMTGRLHDAQRRIDTMTEIAGTWMHKAESERRMHLETAAQLEAARATLQLWEGRS